MSKKTIRKQQGPTNAKQQKSQMAYEITNDAIVDQKLNKLPKSIQHELNGFSVQNRKDAEKSIARLLELKQQYPKVPIIYNFITVAYGFLDKEKQNEAIKDNYKNNPNYLFARCHYAQLCIHQGEPEKTLAIFEKKFDLKALYPRRTLFHVTEYAVFSGVMCAYYNAIGDKEQAQAVYKNMKEMIPDAEETQAVKLLMEPGFFKRIATKLVASLE
jgi:tetratricopeptide (TPR) repeat protein